MTDSAGETALRASRAAEDPQRAREGTTEASGCEWKHFF